jgi:minor histocompatibility antigen H13
VQVVFEAAQPALLYLVPGCIGMSCLAGLLQGSFSQMWNYTEHDEQEEEKKSGNEEPEKKQD